MIGPTGERERAPVAHIDGRGHRRSSTTSPTPCTLDCPPSTRRGEGHRGGGATRFEPAVFVDVAFVADGSGIAWLDAQEDLCGGALLAGGDWESGREEYRRALSLGPHGPVEVPCAAHAVLQRERRAGKRDTGSLAIPVIRADRSGLGQAGMARGWGAWVVLRAMT